MTKFERINNMISGLTDKLLKEKNKQTDVKEAIKFFEKNPEGIYNKMADEMALKLEKKQELLEKFERKVDAFRANQDAAIDKIENELNKKMARCEKTISTIQDEITFLNGVLKDLQ